MPSTFGMWSMQQQLQAIGVGAWSSPVTPQTQTTTYTTVGASTLVIPSWAATLSFKIWGSGGTGTGEGVSVRGGSGGYVGGTFTVTPGDTFTIYVGTNGAGSPTGPAGFGAGTGGEFSYIRNADNSRIAIAGGGGGAGQKASGGAGGGNGPGNNGLGNVGGVGGTQSYGGYAGGGIIGSAGVGTFWNNGSSPQNGGVGGGSGSGAGNRAGGAGSGYYGGGGGSSTGGDGSGGGGGSGFVLNGYDIVSITGNNGVAGGAAAPNNTDPSYVAGRGGSSQDGLVVITIST